MTGTTPQGQFVGRYVWVSLYDLCTGISIFIADGATSDARGFEFLVSPSWPSSSFEGERPISARYYPDDGRWLPATGNLSMADETFAQIRTATPPFGDIRGTLWVNDQGVALSGSFSSPACGVSPGCALP